MAVRSSAVSAAKQPVGGEEGGEAREVEEVERLVEEEAAVGEVQQRQCGQVLAGRGGERVLSRKKEPPCARISSRFCFSVASTGKGEERADGNSR